MPETAALDPALAAVLKRPFSEQVAFFRGKLGRLVPTAKWDDLWKSEHDSAFMVAGAARADLLADLAGAVDKAIAQGETLQAFRQRFAAIVQQRGWHGWTGEGTAAGRDWRTRIIYQTNLSTSYAAGRLAQLQDAGFKLWVYKHSDAVAHPRPQHLAWDGLTLPADHPFWRTHYPPNGWGCRCRVVGASGPATAALLGGKPGYTQPPEGWNALDAKTGEPDGIDKGFGYQPGGTVVDTVRALAGKLATLPAPIGAELGDDLALDKLTDAFSAWAKPLALSSETLFPRGEQFTAGSLSAKVVRRLNDLGIEPSSSALVVRDADVIHTYRDTKDNKIPLDWYLALPRHLAAPGAVLLDKTDPSGALLMVFNVQGQTAKLVVKIDYAIIERGADGIKRKRKANIVRTGKLMDAKALADTTSYEVLDGGL